jgi:Tetracyclin repressor-like, C-terminal domain
MIRLAMARYVVGLEPLANADPETVVAMIAPTIQLYLTEPLPEWGCH